MALDTFTPPIAPSPGQTGKTVNAGTLRADFGDNYSQRSPKGLNSVRATLTLDWEVLAPADADTLEAFFDGKKGATAFVYTPPLESTAKIWTCETWKRGDPYAAQQSFQATLLQEFDMGT